MRNLLTRVWLWLRSPATVFFIIVVAVSFIGRELPPPWNERVQRGNGLLITYAILWLAFQARVHRIELQRHRDEIMGMLQGRSADISLLKKTALELKAETERIAIDLAEDTRKTAKVTHDKIDELGTQIAVSAEASRGAERVANHVNEKIEHLNERLVEQTKTHDGDVELLTTIEQTTTESLHILEKNIQKKLVDGGQLDDMQVTGDESHAMLTKLEEKDGKREDK